MEYELRYPGKEPVDKVLAGTVAARLRKLKTFPPGCRSRGWKNILIQGDNLPALKTLVGLKEKGEITNADGTPGARLVYADPPFSTGLKFRAKGSSHAYDDRVKGNAFIEMLRRRLVLLRELLSEDGSVYLHLDWKKAHCMKVVMDEVFGEENFLNDIIWNYGGRGAKATSRQFSRNHDIILLYRKKGHVFNKLHAENRFPKERGNGFKRDDKGKWFKTSPRGDYTDDSIEKLEREGRVYRTRNGRVRIKYFLREDGKFLVEEKPLGDVWDDIPDGMHLSGAEKTGYPTQKPETLLARIIEASTRSGDLVLDCFAGSGTTLVAAEKLGRRWIGIDSGALSIRTSEKRLITIRGTRGLSGVEKKYPGQCRPFVLLRAALPRGLQGTGPASMTRQR